ncbi:MAG: hypothetical protein HYX22_02795 [Candidatus Yanofskybacteria bacterium]|nr:hypothetical protein [Candidatus Yanofskybacteria bacterium]
MWSNQAAKQALAKYLDPDDGAFGDALGVLTGGMTADFVGIGKVEITLTDEERAELLSAIIKSQQSWFGFSIAHFMSPELESLVCGHKPERYRIIEALS